MLKKVAFTMYPIEDTARARDFYESKLGLTVGSKAANGVWTEYDLPGGGCFALFRGDQVKPSASAGGSVAFEVENLDQLVSRLKADGVTVLQENIVSPVCRMAIVQDTEGNSLILHQLNEK